jgi:hypothetical protein
MAKAREKGDGQCTESDFAVTFLLFDTPSLAGANY